MGKDLHPTEKTGRNPNIIMPDYSDEQNTPIEQDQFIPNQTAETEITNSTIPNTPKKRSKLPSWATVKNNKHAVLAAVLSAILLLIGVTAFLLTRGNSEDVATTEEVVENSGADIARINAAVTYKEGTVQYKNDAGEWVDISDELQPIEGTALKTVGASSRAIITFDDGSALRMDANSEIEFQTLTVERILIKHVNGYTYSRVMPSSSLTYVVTSTDAQYEALGTAFKTAATGDEESVEVYHSSVLETKTNKTPKEGEKLIVKSESDPSKDGTIEKLDIEKVKNDQFIAWNRELDAKDTNFQDKLGFLSDFDAPALTITSHKDGETVLLDANATQGTIEFSGTTDKGSRLTVQIKGGGDPVDVGVDDNGTFKTAVLSTALGNVSFEFVSKDRSGNTVSQLLRINFVKKTATATDTISLTTAVADGKVKAVWSLNGIKTPDGVKLVWSQGQNPTYSPPNYEGYEYITDDSTKKLIDVSEFTSGKTYYFRVCVYKASNSTCDNYSNQSSVAIP